METTRKIMITALVVALVGCLSGAAWADWDPQPPSENPTNHKMHYPQLPNPSGWDVDVEEVLHLGERAATLARLFNLREGFGAADDELPERFFEAFKEGPLAGIAPTPEAVARARHMYYELMGWDLGKGVPQRERLEALGLEEFVGALNS